MDATLVATKQNADKQEADKAIAKLTNLGWTVEYIIKGVETP